MKKKYRKNIRQQQRDNEIHEMNAILAVLYIMYWRDIFVFCCIIVFLYITALISGKSIREALKVVWDMIQK